MKYYKIIEDYPGNALELGSVFSSMISYYDKYPILFEEIDEEEYKRGSFIMKHDASLKPY